MFVWRPVGRTFGSDVASVSVNRVPLPVHAVMADDDPNSQDLNAAILQFESGDWDFNPDVLHEHARQFDRQRFEKEITDLVDRLWSDRNHHSRAKSLGFA